MTDDRLQDLKVICGDLEESETELREIAGDMESEWNRMTDEQQERNEDFENAYLKLMEFADTIKQEISEIMERMEVV
jgi:predicted nucleotide-binding protein (sugar kinase/HSP70/actin superfamily)